MGWMERAIARRGGIVDFRTYMELALYDPDHGYYTAGTIRYGRSGDYLTAPTASEWYAAVVARLVSGLAPDGLRVVDVASGDGSFLAGLLEAWGGSAPAGVELVSVERSAPLRRHQARRFANKAVRIVETFPAPEIAPSGAGLTVLHASELYDALPVHRLVGRPEGLAELHVTVEDGRLVWTERPAPSAVVRHLERRRIVLEEGQLAEVCLDATPVHRRLLEAGGTHGVALVLDYGYPAHRLYDPRGRRGGSLACYAEHRVDRDPLQRPGEKDLTAHVDWDSLREAAAAAGWEEIALVPLAEFLVRAGIGALLEGRGLGLEREVDAESYRARQEVKRLLDPDGMGSDLRVLVQATPAVADTVRKSLGV